MNFKLLSLVIILGATLAKAADPFELIHRADFNGLKSALTQDPTLIKKTNSNKETLLIAASYAGDTEMIQFLLKKSDLNQKDKSGHTALFYAVSNSQEKAAQMLIEAKADLQIKYDSTQDSILHVAARSGTVKVGQIIIEKAPDLLNQTNSLGETPIFESVKSSQSKFAKILIEAGAKKDLKNKKNQSVMDLIDPKVDKKMYRLFRTHEE